MRSGKALRTAALLVMLVLVTMTLSGCHGKVERNAFVLPDALDTETPIEIVFWAKNDNNIHQVNVYRQAIAEFQELYPNITVNLRLYTDYGRIYNDVITNISTDTTPNVCITYPDHIATYLIGDGVVMPLDALMQDERYGLGGSEVRFEAPEKSEIVPEFLQECVIGGQTYAMPFMRSTEALYINRDFVEKLGYEVPDVPTWNFVWEVSEKATEKNPDGTYKVNGQTVMIPFVYKSTDNMMISMLKQLDAPYSTDSGEILIFNDTTKELLLEIYRHAASGAFSTFQTSGHYPGDFLNAGQSIFAIDSTAGATWMGSNAPLMDIDAEQVVPFTTVVRPIPQFDPEHPKMISQGPSVCIFSKENPQEVLASWLFVQYLLTDGIQTGYAETEGYVPVTSRAQQSAGYQDYLSRKGENNQEYYDIKIEASELLMRHTGDTFVTPVFDGSTSLRGAAGQMIERVCKSVLRKKPIDTPEKVDTLYSDVTALYRLDQITGQQGAREILPESRLLLWGIAGIWVILIGARVGLRIRDRKKAKKA